MPQNGREPRVREVFARNLARLSGGEKSIAALCRAIGVNRTQFNRYLTGETHPRPDVLDRICRHFDRDARILLEPLERLDALAARPPGRPDLDFLRETLLPAVSSPIPADSPICGMYQLWRRAFTEPNRALHVLARIGLSDGRMLLRYSEPETLALSRSGPAVSRKRAHYHGLCLGHLDGFSAIIADKAYKPGQHMFGTLFCEYPNPALGHLLTGALLLTRRPGLGLSRTVSVVLERLPPSFGVWAAVARQPVLLEMEDVPAIIRRSITQLPPNV